MVKSIFDLLIKQLKFGVIAFMVFIAPNFSFAQYGLAIDSIEAENGTMTGVFESNTLSGYSGSGYVTGFDSVNNKVTVKPTIKEKGAYEIIIRYASAIRRIQYLIINAEDTVSKSFPPTKTFSNFDAGDYILKAGDSITIQFRQGGTDIDKFTFYQVKKKDYTISPFLVDSGADSATIALYNFLVTNFGKKIISGQTENNYEDIKTITGQSPILKVSDMQHYSAGYSYLWKNGGFSFGWDDNHNSENMINWYKSTGKKGIVGFQWHWHSPSGGKPGVNTFYTSETKFDASKAVIDGTEENIAVIRDIDSIASQLKKFQRAGIPVLWRPLHEASGNGKVDGSEAWFWWGAKGATVCKKLYTILYDRITNFHQIHNLIWVWSSPQSEWYPGNDVVDIVGFDSYPSAYNYTNQKTMFDQYYKYTGGQKIIAMSENGPIPDPDNCIYMNAPWSYFMTWGDLVLSQNTKIHINEVYSHPDVLTLGYINSTVLKIAVDKLTIDGAAKTEQSFNIYSNMNWTVTSNASWLTVNNEAGSGNATITLTALANNGAARVAVVTISGKGLKDQKITVTQELGITGAVNLRKIENFALYPNPNNGKFTLLLDNLNCDNFNVSIISQSGIVLKDFEITNASSVPDHEIDASNLAKGLYFIDIKTNNTQMTKGFIIQ